MDLGAAICTPKRPACPNCPWTEDCQARKRGIQESLPVKAPKTRAAPEARRRLCRARRNGRGAAGQAAGQGLAGLDAGAAAGPMDGGFSVNRTRRMKQAPFRRLEEARRHRAPRLHPFRTGDRSLCRRCGAKRPNSHRAMDRRREKLARGGVAHRDAQDRRAWPGRRRPACSRFRPVRPAGADAARRSAPARRSAVRTARRSSHCRHPAPAHARRCGGSSRWRRRRPACRRRAPWRV